MEYTSKNGVVLTGEMLEEDALAYERGELPQGPVVAESVGNTVKTEEPLKSLDTNVLPEK